MEVTYACKKGMLECSMIRKTNPPPFLLKTYMLVDDPATDAVVSWNDGGTAFVVWQPAEFARDLLPTLFKHCNFSSFVRQLNTYGFRKVATSRWEFCNEMFQRGKMEMLSRIGRRKAWTQRQPHAVATNSGAPRNVDDDQTSTSSFSELNTLVDENKRLKKENGVLNSELKHMKNKCKELLELVAIFANRKDDGEGNDGKDNDYEKQQPVLFGVRLELLEERQ